MSFRQSTIGIARFNSATSSEFMSFYQNFVIQKIVKEKSKTPEPVFRPSSFRCDRMCWFMIRGVEPDDIGNPDPVMQHKADVGTGCHRVIQGNLIEALGDDWIDVEQHLKDNPMPWEYTLTREGPECAIRIPELQFKFSCDGIVRWKGKKYLLEVKTVEPGPLEEMVDPRFDHIDQVKCYATMLGLDGVLFLYQDRTFGNLKCYEVNIPIEDKTFVLDKVTRIRRMRDDNIAPPKLESGDRTCSGCGYKLKCKQWG